MSGYQPNFGYQREASGFTIWTLSPHTGSKIDCLDWVDTERQAQRKVNALYKEQGR